MALAKRHIVHATPEKKEQRQVHIPISRKGSRTESRGGRIFSKEHFVQIALAIDAKGYIAIQKKIK